MNPLERRCRTLLRAYPRWYRRQRGDEMLATLLEASLPGQRWPSARDTRALIMGGLRVRATQDQRLTTAANLRLAAQLGAALTLLFLIAGSLTSAILIWAHIYAQHIGVLEALTVLEPLRFLSVPLAVVPLIILGLVAGWAFVDARPAMAMAIFIACIYVVYLLLSSVRYGRVAVPPVPGLLIFVTAAVVLASGSFWQLRRQAVL